MKTIQEMLQFCKDNPNKHFTYWDFPLWEDLDNWCFALESNTVPFNHTTNSFLAIWKMFVEQIGESDAINDVQCSFNDI